MAPGEFATEKHLLPVQIFQGDAGARSPFSHFANKPNSFFNASKLIDNFACNSQAVDNNFFRVGHFKILHRVTRHFG